MSSMYVDMWTREVWYVDMWYVDMWNVDCGSIAYVDYAVNT
jgi:hypothetical protein